MQASLARYHSLKSPRVPVRLDHVARFIVNANHGRHVTAEKLRIAIRIADCVRFAVPQPTEWQRVGN